MSDQPREDDTASDDSFEDPTAPSHEEWSPRPWEARDASASSTGSDETQEVGTDPTQHLPHEPPPPPKTYGSPPSSADAGNTIPNWQNPAFGTPLPPPGSSPTPSPAPDPDPAPTPPQDPYPVPSPPPSGASPYGTPGTPYGTPPPAYYQQAPSQSNTSALILTILSGVGIFMCCGVTIVSLILGIIALTKQATDPVASAKFTKWGWIAFVAGFVLAIIGFFVYVASMAALSPEFTSGTGY